MIQAIIAGTAAVVGAVGQAFNNAKATKAEKSELKKIEEVQKKIQRPNFDFSELTPEDLRVVYNYNPQAAQVVEEAAPDLVEKSQVAQQGTQAQLSALERFGQLAETGDDEITQAERARARREAEEGFSRASKVREAQAQRRGLGLGSGAQFALSQADQSALGQQQQIANEQAAADAALRRMQASQMQAGVGGQLTNQELSLAGQNAAFVNAFNQRSADRAQGVEMSNVDAQNQAARERALLQNTAQQQSTTQRNESARLNQQQKNQLRQQQFQNESQLFGQQAGISQMRQDHIGRRSDRTARTIEGLSSGVAGAAGAFS